jgi:hypothetical protein
MAIRPSDVQVIDGKVSVVSHIMGVTPDEALELAAMIITAANEARKPEFEPGGYYLDADGDFFIRNDDNDGWTDDRHDTYSDGFPTRPIVRLVPETEVN